MKGYPKILITFFLIKNIAFGQDLHYTQFYNAHVNINPALTGIFNGDTRLAANFRNQWSSVPVPYNTVTAAADFKINKSCKPAFWGAGLVLNYDKAGDSQLNLATLGLNSSYSIPIKENAFFTMGAQLGFSRRAFSIDDLAFDEQWDGSKYVFSKTITDAFDRRAVFIPDLSLGVNYRIQKSIRTKLDIGLAMFHVNRPQSPFYIDDKSVKLPVRFALNLSSSNRINSEWDLLIHGLAQFQRTYHEIIIGAGPKYYLNQKAGKIYSLGLLLHYRLKDALAPAFQLQLNDLQIGLSYDVTTSPFKIATGQKGGPELSLIYLINKIKPFGRPKYCPIY